MYTKKKEQKRDTKYLSEVLYGCGVGGGWKKGIALYFSICFEIFFAHIILQQKQRQKFFFYKKKKPTKK